MLSTRTCCAINSTHGLSATGRSWGTLQVGGSHIAISVACGASTQVRSMVSLDCSAAADTFAGHTDIRDAAPGDETAGPNGITLDRAGNVYVTDCGNHQVVKYSATGKIIGSWRLQGSRPHLFGGFSLGGIALDGYGNVYVADRYTNTLVKLSPTGAVLARIKGKGAGRLIRPYGVGLDTAGSIYVTRDFGPQARIVKLSPSGNVMAVWR